MKVFISWSGETSRRVAELLKEYLPTIIQSTDPFMSKHDIDSGSRWASEITNALEETNFGISCLTPTNLEAPWLLFEAGALTKLQNSSLCSLLIGNLKASDVKQPLSQFQNNVFTKDGLYKLFADINKNTKQPVNATPLKSLFDKFWPDIEEKYQEILNNTSETPVTVSRPTDDMIEEILTTVRAVHKNTYKPRGLLKREGLTRVGLGSRDGLTRAGLGLNPTTILAPEPGDTEEGKIERLAEMILTSEEKEE